MIEKPVYSREEVNIEYDAIDEYLECVTDCSLTDKGIHCLTQCIGIHLKKEIKQ